METTLPRYEKSENSVELIRSNLKYEKNVKNDFKGPQLNLYYLTLLQH